MRLAVVGASGFIGTAVCEAALDHGHDVLRLRAPRLTAVDPSSGPTFVRSRPPEFAGLCEELRGAGAVVNAAGISEASSTDVPNLLRANAILPGLISAAAAELGSVRLVHVSSAAVQGRLRPLDDSFTYKPFSDYSRSKALGEQFALRFSDGNAVLYRPGGVHASGRRVTQQAAKLAASTLRSVASPGDDPTPQALVSNVANAIVFLATCSTVPPLVVIHPWEQLTTFDLMELLGGRRPHLIPRSLARLLVAAITAAGRGAPQLAAQARRMDMLWFGQSQSPSWLTSAGWTPPEGRAAWQILGQDLRQAQAAVRVNPA